MKDIETCMNGDYIPRIPFKWEQKPGTPHVSFARETVLEINKPLPLPPGYFGGKFCGNESDCSESSVEPDWISALDCDEVSCNGDGFKGSYNSSSSREEIGNVGLKDGLFVDDCSVLGLYRSNSDRRDPTLGELMMLSRRMTYHRKVVHMKKHNQQKDCAKNKVQGCFDFDFDFEVGAGIISKLFWKNLLTLKLRDRLNL